MHGRSWTDAFARWRATRAAGELRLNYPPHWMDKVSEVAFRAGWVAGLEATAQETTERETRRLHLGGPDKGGDGFAAAVLFVIVAGALGCGVVIGGLFI